MNQLINLQVTNRGQNLDPIKGGPLAYGFDIEDIVSPIRYNSNLNKCYFTARTIKDGANNNLNGAKIDYMATDSLASIQAQSVLLLLLNVTIRRGVNMGAEAHIFVASKISENIIPAANGGSTFFYIEDGDVLPVEYTVSQSVTTIMAQTVPTPPVIPPMEVPITWTALRALRNAGTLVPGTTYKITDRYNYQDNGTGLIPNQTFQGDDRGFVYIKALEVNLLSNVVERVMACPISYASGVPYGAFTNSIGIWHINKTAGFGYAAIWGGKVWSNTDLAGPIGTATDEVTLTGPVWGYISKQGNPSYYVDKKFACIYDFDNDWFVSQTDGSNEVGIPFASRGSLIYNPCDITDWNYPASVFFNNKAPFGVFNNPVSYLFNNICRGKISANLGSFLIHNQCNDITGNKVTYLNYNYSYNIVENNGTFMVYNRNVDGDVVQNNVSNMSYNSNFGYIYNNTCSNLSRNTNAGVIDGNTCVSMIDNANSGDIMGNTLTQNIEKNTSAVGTILNITGQYSFAKDTLHTTASLVGYEIDITGLSAVDLTAPLAPYISKVFMLSSNASEVITDVLNMQNDKIVRFTPDTSVTAVTFTNNAAKIRCEGAISAVLDGSNQDWIELEHPINYLGSVVRQYNIGTY